MITHSTPYSDISDLLRKTHFFHQKVIYDVKPSRPEPPVREEEAAVHGPARGTRRLGPGRTDAGGGDRSQEEGRTGLIKLLRQREFAFPESTDWSALKNTRRIVAVLRGVQRDF
jgi:hypothetical protein